MCSKTCPERVEGTAVAIADIRRDRHGSTESRRPQLACETGFDRPPAPGVIRAAVRQGPNGVQVLRQDNDGVDGEAVRPAPNETRRATTRRAESKHPTTGPAKSP